MKRRPDPFDLLEWVFSLAIIALLVLGFLAVIVGPADAGPAFCAERTQIAERLDAKYHEQLVGGGMQNSNGLIEVWISENGATWTILMTQPDGLSCVMASGTDWYSRPFQIDPPGEAG